MNAPHPKIPPLAGLCDYESGAKLGYGVDQTVELLRRYAYIEAETMRCLAAHINATPYWEAKCALCYHLWLDAEHATLWRERVAEMRTPPLHLDRVPDPALADLFAELIRAESALELLVGVYCVLKPAYVEALKRHLARANPVADQPTLRLIKIVLAEETEQLAWGERAVDALREALDPAEADTSAWVRHLQQFVTAAGGIAGDGERTSPPPAHWRATQPFEPVREARRDARVAELWNSRGRGPTGDQVTDAERNWWNLYVRLTEMHVPELIALILFDWREQPWAFYRDVARHLWDECRHAMMGEVAFETRGVDWTSVPHEISFAEYPNTHFPPRERYTLLWGIEQGLMKATGKRRQYEIAVRSGDALSQTFHDFDWADEVLHAQIGRRWLKPVYPSEAALRAAFEACHSEYQAVLKADQALERANWWPSFYAQVRSGRKTRPET